MKSVSKCTAIGQAGWKRIQYTYLNILDPFGEEQCAHAFRHGTYIRIDRANDTDACVACQRWLEHPCQLGVSVWDVVTEAGTHR
jgi:hypothetical protein